MLLAVLAELGAAAAMGHDTACQGMAGEQEDLVIDKPLDARIDKASCGREGWSGMARRHGPLVTKGGNAEEEANWHNADPVT